MVSPLIRFSNNLGQFPRLRHAMRSLQSIRLRTRRVQMRIEHLNLPNPFDLNRNSTNGFGSEEISFNEMKRVAR